MPVRHTAGPFAPWEAAAMKQQSTERPKGDAMIRTLTTATRELAFRATDGLEVTLLWHTRTDVLSVAVNDSRTGEAFELVLGENEKPLDVFEHPYAYAAYRGLDYGATAEVALAA